MFRLSLYSFPKIMVVAKLCCMDYGFECNFEAEGQVDSVIKKFAEHTSQEHGIEYSKEALMQFIVRKGQS